MLSAVFAGGTSMVLAQSAELAKLSKQEIHQAAVKELQRVAGDEMKKLGATMDGKTFLQWLCTSPERMGDLMLSGPLPKDANKTLRVLFGIWKADRKGLEKREEQTTAAAVALTFGKDNWPEDKALNRYKLYAESRVQGKLNQVFDTLDAREKRFVVSGGGNGGWADKGGWSDEAFVWLRDHVKLPIQDYPGACWQAPYRLENIFGDSIHGNRYYAPFKDMNYAKTVREVGGVCGSLSHFGANAARANGIPAITMGEPGHCAYAVRVGKNNWVPSYSIFWQRYPHTSLWEQTWSQLVLQEKFYNETNAVAQSMGHVWMARDFLAKGDTTKAETEYSLALQSGPLNYPAWVETVEFLVKENKLTKKQWQTTEQAVLAALGAYPEVAWSVIEKFAKTAMDTMSMSEKEAFILAFHKTISTQEGPSMWAIDKALDDQMKLLGGSKQDQANVYEKILTLQTASKSWFSPTVSFGQKLLGESDPDLYFGILSRAFSSAESQSGVDENSMRGALNQAIVAVEKAKNVDAFQALGKMAYKKLNGSPSPNAGVKYPDMLLSSGGMLLPTSTCQHDNPSNHWGVIEESGGSFHTNNEVHAGVVVKLGKLGEVHGIVIEGTGGQNGGRLLPMKVSVSEDGTNWKEIFRTNTYQDVWKIDVKDGDAPRVQYVKVERDGDEKNFFHLYAVRVYGKRLQ